MSDPRFARLKTDPRFRKPKKKSTKVVVDERFKSVLKQEKKKDKAGRSIHPLTDELLLSKTPTAGLVDKYGRKLSSTHEEDNLKRFYRLEGDEDEENEEEERRPDYARGEVLLESSDEEEEDTKDNDDDESDSGGIVKLGGSDSENAFDEDPLAEIDLDEENLAALDAQAAAYNRELPSEDEGGEESPRTRRLAVVNLDWDHVRAGHLYKIFASVVSPTAPSTASVPQRKQKKDMDSATRKIKEAPQLNVVRGKVLSVVVYPSDFGKERMAREEREGPPAEIFRKKKTSDDLYELGGEDEVDDNALRKYQLERLRSTSPNPHIMPT